VEKLKEGSNTMTVQPIELRKLIPRATNIYEAIAVMSKRARQLNEDMKLELNQRLEMIQTKLTENTEEVEAETNPDQLKISYEFEKRPKPTETAIKEMLEGRIEFRYKEKEDAEKKNEE
jgi:DNA-directed RNA polymerase subunit K/omega